MNDEIKEILDDLKHYSYCYDNYDKEKYNINRLLDYITNLQQENQELNDSITWWNNRFNAVQRDYEDYKSRCEKAVEYINQHHAMYIPSACGDVIKYVPLEFQRHYYKNGSTFIENEDLLNILNGRSDE